MNWAEAELSGLSLGDARLDKRACKLLSSLSHRPQASIPQACGGAAEIKAAYRLLDRDDVDWRDLMAPHWDRSLQRMSGEAVVLCIQDTTELNFNGRQTQGLGRLSYDAQRGMYAHLTYAVTTQRLPLGVLDCWMWARKERGEPDLAESTRWIEGYERLADMAADLPDTRLVYVADREADMLSLMKRARDLDTPVDWLVRAAHNRCLPDGDKLFAQACADDAAGEIEFVMPARHGGKARKVRQQLWASRVVLPAGKDAPVSVTCIVARECDAPDGVKPIEWRLLTNRSADTPEAIVELIDWYRARWEIEMYFHIVKTGCRVEQLQLESVDRIERALGLYLMVAWRIHYLMRLGRECPNLDCDIVFEKDEWQAAYLLAKKKPPASIPTLNDVIRLVAAAGGFMGRKGDGQPGAKAIWSGMQALYFFVAGMRAAREIASGESYG